jgi:hypothetical protein
MKFDFNKKIIQLIMSNSMMKNQFQNTLNLCIQNLTKVYKYMYPEYTVNIQPVEVKEACKPKYARKETTLEKVYNYLVEHPESSAKEITQGIYEVSDRASIRRVSFSLSRLKRNGQIEFIGSKRWQVIDRSGDDNCSRNQ